MCIIVAFLRMILEQFSINGFAARLNYAMIRLIGFLNYINEVLNEYSMKVLSQLHIIVLVNSYFVSSVCSVEPFNMTHMKTN